jgi:hypothetical protein
MCVTVFGGGWQARWLASRHASFSGLQLPCVCTFMGSTAVVAWVTRGTGGVDGISTVSVTLLIEACPESAWLSVCARKGIVSVKLALWRATAFGESGQRSRT